MTNDLMPHASSRSSQTSGNGADAQPCPASPSDLAWLTRAGTGFERYVLLEAAGARVCTAAAFAHTARVRFEMGVPRAYGFIQPKWEVHGDGAVGDDLVLSFDMAWDGYVNGVDCYHCEVNIADILNALMAIPNLIAVLLLSPVIVKETKRYLDDLDAKDDTEIPVIKK